ncbi:MAG: hypothetical protein AAGG51_18620 [Cyanobacteria bacterium P01_G01_bin.54]
MWIWVAAVGLLFLGAQLYDWWLQATLPFWLQALAGLGLAILSATPLQRTAVERDSSPSQPVPPQPASPQTDKSIDSISFTIETPRRDRA